MLVNGIICKKCNTFIYSRSRHDFRWCPCKSCAIDGGQEDYIHTIGTMDDWKPHREEINCTIKDLYDDYNTNKNEYGMIKL